MSQDMTRFVASGASSVDVRMAVSPVICTDETWGCAASHFALAAALSAELLFLRALARMAALSCVLPSELIERYSGRRSASRKATSPEDSARFHPSLAATMAAWVWGSEDPD